EHSAIVADALGALLRNGMSLQVINREIRNGGGPPSCLADFNRILAAHGIREHRACLFLRLIQGQQRTVLPDGQAPRRTRVPVAILDDVAADPTGLLPNPKAG